MKPNGLYRKLMNKQFYVSIMELPQDRPIIPAISKLEQKDGEDFIAYIARPCLKTNKNKAVGTGGLSERLLKPSSIGENRA